MRPALWIFRICILRSVLVIRCFTFNVGIFTATCEIVCLMFQNCLLLFSVWMRSAKVHWYTGRFFHSRFYHHKYCVISYWFFLENSPFCRIIHAEVTIPFILRFFLNFWYNKLRACTVLTFIAFVLHLIASRAYYMRSPAFISFWKLNVEVFCIYVPNFPSSILSKFWDFIFRTNVIKLILIVSTTMRLF